MSIPKSVACFAAAWAAFAMVSAAGPQQLTPEITAKPAYLFPLTPATGGASATIAYWLDGPAHAVRLDVRNAAGQLMAAVPARRARGVNRASWNLRTIPPGLNIREVREEAAERRLWLPLVPPGLYTVTMTVDGTTETQKLEVRDDPRLTRMTPAERQAWTDAQVRLWQIMLSADQERTTAVALAEQARVLPGPSMPSLKKKFTAAAEPLEEIDERAGSLLKRIESSGKPVTAAQGRTIDEEGRMLDRRKADVEALRQQLKQEAGGRR